MLAARSIIRRLCALLLILAPFSSAAAQPNFALTVVVDPNGNPDANETTIQGAIAILPSSSDRKTILVYAGVYEENIVLNADVKDVDIVGVDPEAVVIAGAATGGNVVTIIGDGVRNITLRNLTIIDRDEEGQAGNVAVLIREDTGAVAPSAIRLENVRIIGKGEAGKGPLGAHEHACPQPIKTLSFTRAARLLGRALLPSLAFFPH